MALRRIEHDTQLAFARACTRDKFRQRPIDPEARILQVDRVDRMLGHRHFDARPANHALRTEADDARQPAPRTSFHNPVEIDEADGFAVAVWMRDAGAQPAGHERQMRVGVFWLGGALDGVEVRPAIELVVLVAGTLRKDGAKCLDERGNVLFAKPRRYAAVEESGGRVRRPVQTVGVTGERFVFRGESRPHLDHIEARLGSHLEGEVQRFGRCHPGITA